MVTIVSVRPEYHITMAYQMKSMMTTKVLKMNDYECLRKYITPIKTMKQFHLQFAKEWPMISKLPKRLWKHVIMAGGALNACYNGVLKHRIVDGQSHYRRITDLDFFTFATTEETCHRFAKDIEHSLVQACQEHWKSVLQLMIHDDIMLLQKPKLKLKQGSYHWLHWTFDDYLDLVGQSTYYHSKSRYMENLHTGRTNAENDNGHDDDDDEDNGNDNRNNRPRSLESINDIVIQIQRYAKSPGIVIIKADGCTTIYYGPQRGQTMKYRKCSAEEESRGSGKHMFKFQIIHRAYTSVAQILRGFDLQGSMIAYDLTNLFMTEWSRFAYRTGFLVVDPSRRSTTYEKRIQKYMTHYGWLGLIFPKMDLSESFSLDKVQPLYPSLSSSLSLEISLSSPSDDNSKMFPLLSKCINDRNYSEFRISLPHLAFFTNIAAPNVMLHYNSWASADMRSKVKRLKSRSRSISKPSSSSASSSSSSSSSASEPPSMTTISEDDILTKSNNNNDTKRTTLTTMSVAQVICSDTDVGEKQKNDNLWYKYNELSVYDFIGHRDAQQTLTDTIWWNLFELCSCVRHWPIFESIRSHAKFILNKSHSYSDTFPINTDALYSVSQKSSSLLKMIPNEGKLSKTSIKATRTDKNKVKLNIGFVNDVDETLNITIVLVSSKEIKRDRGRPPKFAEHKIPNVFKWWHSNEKKQSVSSSSSSSSSSLSSLPDSDSNVTAQATMGHQPRLIHTRNLTQSRGRVNFYWPLHTRRKFFHFDIFNQTLSSSSSYDMREVNATLPADDTYNLSIPQVSQQDIGWAIDSLFHVNIMDINKLQVDGLFPRMTIETILKRFMSVIDYEKDWMTYISRLYSPQVRQRRTNEKKRCLMFKKMMHFQGWAMYQALQIVSSMKPFPRWIADNPGTQQPFTGSLYPLATDDVQWYGKWLTR
jgi:hypothetical protein